MNRVTAAIGIVVLSSASSPVSSEPQTVKLAPHRAVYDLTLAKGAGSASIEDVRGRVAFDYTGDACEGYALNYRQVTVMGGSEGRAQTLDVRAATFESGDGTSLRFKTEKNEGETRDDVDGTAEIHGGILTVKLRQPHDETFSVPGEVMFPAAHMKRLIMAARAGETTLNVKIFDGMDDGRKVFDTLAVIGRRIEAGHGEDREPPARQESLARLPRWPVTLSYFAPGEGERTPIYTISFELYENGVSRALRLDYGDFTLNGDLQNLEPHPVSTCAR